MVHLTSELLHLVLQTHDFKVLLVLQLGLLDVMPRQLNRAQVLEIITALALFGSRAGSADVLRRFGTTVLGAQHGASD